MNLPISHRLLSCAGFIPRGSRVADIGCDHGYLSIYLLKEGIAQSVIASDIHQGPLESAKRNAQRFGVKEKIAFYLSDGAKKIPRDFDVLVCAGMGADTMISILEAAPWLCSEPYTLVLQCQSKGPMLREYLYRQGWCIEEETALQDGKFLYTVMKVTWQGKATLLSPGQCWFSPALARNQSPEAAQYRQQTILKLQRAVDARGEKADPFMAAALTELTEKEHFCDHC